MNEMVIFIRSVILMTLPAAFPMATVNILIYDSLCVSVVMCFVSRKDTRHFSL